MWLTQLIKLFIVSLGKLFIICLICKEWLADCFMLFY